MFQSPPSPSQVTFTDLAVFPAAEDRISVTSTRVYKPFSQSLNFDPEYLAYTPQGVAKRLLLQLRAVIRNTKGGRVFSPTVPRFPGDKQEDAWEYIASILGKIPRCSHVFHGLHKITSVCTKYKCSGKSVQENVPLPGYVLNVDILANGNLRDALLTFKYQSGQDGDPNVTFAKCPGCGSTDARVHFLFSTAREL